MWDLIFYISTDNYTFVLYFTTLPIIFKVTFDPLILNEKKQPHF